MEGSQQSKTAWIKIADLGKFCKTHGFVGTLMGLSPYPRRHLGASKGPWSLDLLTLRVHLTPWIQEKGSKRVWPEPLIKLQSRRTADSGGQLRNHHCTEMRSSHGIESAWLQHYTLLLSLGKSKIPLTTYQNKSPNGGFRHSLKKKIIEKIKQEQNHKRKVHELHYI